LLDRIDDINAQKRKRALYFIDELSKFDFWFLGFIFTFNLALKIFRLGSPAKGYFDEEGNSLIDNIEGLSIQDEDYDFIDRVMEISKVANVPECLYNFRLSKESKDRAAEYRRIHRIIQYKTYCRLKGIEFDPNNYNDPDWLRI